MAAAAASSMAVATATTTTLSLSPSVRTPAAQFQVRTGAFSRGFEVLLVWKKQRTVQYFKNHRSLEILESFHSRMVEAADQPHGSPVEPNVPVCSVTEISLSVCTPPHPRLSHINLVFVVSGRALQEDQASAPHQSGVKAPRMAPVPLRSADPQRIGELAGPFHPGGVGATEALPLDTCTHISSRFDLGQNQLGVSGNHLWLVEPAAHGSRFWPFLALPD